MIMAGGTGGHVYPALAVAEYLREKGVSVVWLGTALGLEARVVPENGYSLITMQVIGLRGKGVLRLLTAPFMLTAALWQAVWILLRIRPQAVLGMGGFVSGPGGVAAWLLRLPLYIHEQNAIAGLTNRLLAPLAKAVMAGFPGAFKENSRVRVTGNPVRWELANLPPPVARQAGRATDVIHLLVLGGSLGAKALNEVVPAALQQLPEWVKIHIWHQAGPRHIQGAKAHYGAVQGEIECRIVPYIDDMEAAYGWADLVLCRAGALTIAELCAVGIASILVPFPFAVDDHQTSNARHLVEHGGGVLIPESELAADKLAALLSELHQARDRLLDMANRARELARPDATRDVGDICLEGVYA